MNIKIAKMVKNQNIWIGHKKRARPSTTAGPGPKGGKVWSEVEAEGGAAAHAFLPPGKAEDLGVDGKVP